MTPLGKGSTRRKIQEQEPGENASRCAHVSAPGGAEPLGHGLRLGRVARTGTSSARASGFRDIGKGLIRDYNECAMAIFYVQGTLSHPGDPKLKRRLRFMVDSGAFFTVVPREVLSSLKIRPVRKETVQFADGRRARWKVGEARLEADGRSVTTLVLFGKKGTQALLGAYSLDGLGLSVDSRHRRLFPMPIVIVAAA